MAATYPAIAQVDAYWEGLRNGRLMPSRSEVDPRGIEASLDYAMLLEEIAPGVAKIRVNGQHLNSLLGMEVRGMPLTSFIEPAYRSQFMDAVQSVGSCPQVTEISLQSPNGIGRPPLSARLYLAPLSTEAKDHGRLLACLQSRGSIGRTPRRFAIEEIHNRRIVAAAHDLSDDHPRPLHLKPEVREFAEPSAKFTAAPQATATKHPHLRLVKTDTDKSS